jgi:hypothetical protein
MVQPGVSALGKKNSTTALPRKSFKETSLPFWSGRVNSGALSLTCMALSPGSILYRPKLYSRARIIIAGLIFSAPIVFAQFARREPPDKGPRALGLLELAPNGKAHLVPIAIMYDGKFYDAGAYKASPVPMAIASGTVYEGLKTGVSQGLFTVSQPGQTQGVWTAEGTWEAAGSTPPPKKGVPPRPKDDDLDKPPVLRHADSEPPEPRQPQPVAPAPPPVPSPSASPPPPPAPAQKQDNDQGNDKDRPLLRRGKAAAKEEELKQEQAVPAKSSKPPAPPATKTNASALQILPAISDAGGPDPRPYAYTMKPDEEQAFRKKMLVLASEEVRARARQLAATATGSSAPASPRLNKVPTSRSAQPIFEDLQLRVFYLSNTNDPVLVLTADARIPQRPGAATADTQYFITLIARQDTYGELKKAFTNITDNLHLDAIPRLELVDAVDADGDGRGELLFRKISDAGRAFNIYRVVGDQLYPLFEGTAQ